MERSITPLRYFSFQPVLHNWCNIDHGMYYLVLEGVANEVAAAGFLLGMVLMPYNGKLKNVEGIVN